MHREPLGPQLSGYAVAFLLGLGVSSLAVHLALDVAGTPAARLETVIALAAGGLATVVRFVLMSLWVFGPGQVAAA